MKGRCFFCSVCEAIIAIQQNTTQDTTAIKNKAMKTISTAGISTSITPLQSSGSIINAFCHCEDQHND